MDPLSQTRLLSLTKISNGHPDTSIGLIDGPVDFSHPAFQGSRIRTVRDSQLTACKNANDIRVYMAHLLQVSFAPSVDFQHLQYVQIVRLF